MSVLREGKIGVTTSLGLLMKDIETAGWPGKRELANGFETQVHNEEQRYRKQNT